MLEIEADDDRSEPGEVRGAPRIRSTRHHLIGLTLSTRGEFQGLSHPVNMAGLINMYGDAKFPFPFGMMIMNSRTEGARQTLQHFLCPSRYAIPQ